MEKLNSILKEKIKCLIVEGLMKKEHSFSELLTLADLKDHGQLNYHLKILIDNGLVKKNGVYGITPLGIKMGVYVSQFQLKELYPVSVVCPIVKNKSEQILLVKRAKEPYKGFWGFPGGKIRIGETIEQAVHREVMEETGLKVKFHGTKGFMPVIVMRKGELEFHANLIPVIAHLEKEQEVKLNDEHDEYCFVKVEEANKLKLVPANKEILANLDKEFYFREAIISDDVLI